jgi:hypothetical protein
MDQTADDIRYDVDLARARLGADLNELQYRMKSELDWRVHFRRRPWAFLAAAFGLAALFAMAISGRPRRQAPALR